MRHDLITAALLAVGLATLGVVAAPAMADDDHERARQALQQGLARPLSEILAKVKTELPGEIIEVELDSEDGAYVYEFKVLTPQGRVEEVEVDAKTAAILKREDDD